MAFPSNHPSDYWYSGAANHISNPSFSHGLDQPFAPTGDHLSYAGMGPLGFDQGPFYGASIPGIPGSSTAPEPNSFWHEGAQHKLQVTANVIIDQGGDWGMYQKHIDPLGELQIKQRVHKSGLMFVYNNSSQAPVTAEVRQSALSLSALNAYLKTDAGIARYGPDVDRFGNRLMRDWRLSGMLMDDEEKIADAPTVVGVAVAYRAEIPNVWTKVNFDYHAGAKYGVAMTTHSFLWLRVRNEVVETSDGQRVSCHQLVPYCTNRREEPQNEGARAVLYIGMVNTIEPGTNLTGYRTDIIDSAAQPATNIDKAISPEINEDYRRFVRPLPSVEVSMRANIVHF